VNAWSDLRSGVPAEGLLPGDLAGILGLVDTITRYAELCADSALRLERIEVEWTGEAAAAFHTKFALEPRRYRDACSAFDQAAQALNEYAIELERCRAEAAICIAWWGRGLALAQAASNKHPGDPVFSPVGADLRHDAAGKLDGLYADIDAAANRAADRLVAAQAAAPEARHWWDRLALSAYQSTLAGGYRTQQALSVGTGRGISDLLLSSTSGRTYLAQAVDYQLDGWERQHGLNPHGGVHEIGRYSTALIPIPGAAAVTAEAVLERLAQRLSARGLSDATVAAIAKATVEDSPWSLPPLKRGYAIEALRGGNLNYGFPTFDRLIDRVATSIKSVDLAAPTYQSTSRLEYVLNGYVNKVADFGVRQHGDTAIDGRLLAGRELEICVPPGTATAEQIAVLDRVVRYGELHNVTVTVLEVP